MKLLFLRGQVPSDRPKEQIMFDELERCDDMWTQLAFATLQKGDYGELWYEKGQRVRRYRDNFVERWVTRYSRYRSAFEPDVVFSRGGFPFQLAEARRHPGAVKIYYGAGQRAVPKAGQPWDIVLTDTFKQRDAAASRGYDARMFVKPAADNIFRPPSFQTDAKKYDIIVVANWNPNANKGLRYLLPELNRLGYRVLHVGIYKPAWAKLYKRTDFVGWSARELLPAFYAMSKAAIVWATGKDSCPRVVPEALACNCPLIVNRNTKLWTEKYITPTTGAVASKETFASVVRDVSRRWRDFSPRAYYEYNLSLSAAATQIREMISCGKRNCTEAAASRIIDGDGASSRRTDAK